MPPRPFPTLSTPFCAALLLFWLVACGDAAPPPPAGGDALLPDLPDLSDDPLPDLDAADLDVADAPADTPVEDLEHLGERLFGLPVMHVEVDHDALLGLLSAPQRRDSLPVSVRYDGRQYDDAELELHGGFARTVPKRSFRLDFPDDERLWIAFGGAVEGHRTIVLQASWIDPTFQRNRVTFDSVRQLGGLAPRATYAPLAFNGRFYGFYVVLERVDEVFLWRHALDRSGSMYKAENHAANWAWRPDVLAGYAVPLHPERSPDDLDLLLRRVTNTPTDAVAFAREVEPVLELDDVLTWQLVHSYAQNTDAFTKNYYLYHDRAALPGSPEDRFRVISWDADATWGMNWDGTPLPSDRETWYGTDRFAPRLFAIATWRDRYLARWSDALDGPLRAEILIGDVERTHGSIGRLVELDARIWPRGRGTEAEVDALSESIAERHRRMRRVVDEVR